MQPNNFYKQILIEGLGIIELLKADGKWWGFVRVVNPPEDQSQRMELIKLAHEVAIANGCEKPDFLVDKTQDFVINLEFIHYYGHHLKGAELVEWDGRVVGYQDQFYDTPNQAKAAHPEMEFCFATRVEYPDEELLVDAIISKLSTFYDDQWKEPAVNLPLRMALQAYCNELKDWGRYRRVADFSRVIPLEQSDELLSVEI